MRFHTIALYPSTCNASTITPYVINDTAYPGLERIVRRRRLEHSAEEQVPKRWVHPDLITAGYNRVTDAAHLLLSERVEGASTITTSSDSSMSIYDLHTGSLP